MQTAFIAALAALMLASAQAQSSNGATGVVSVTSESSNNSKEPLSSSSNASPTESSQTPTPTHTPTPTPTSNTASPSSTASSFSVAPTRSVKPDPSVTPPHSSTTETDDNGDTPTHQLPTHAPTTRPSNPSRPTPTWTLLPTTKPDIPAPSPTSRSKQTVIAVITVVVDGSVSLSSETTVIDDGSVGYGENESDGRAESSGRPFTSTIFENGSAVVVTGNLDDPQNVNSGAMRSVAGLSMKTALAASAAALVLVAFF
ncbi:hypothetical protein GGH94_004266 [Coemansia aciculifera]|uniref:REJ domain-containing protein n=1 Tax=Coemansia aciculifera TaxID=417176 RepID=A0A9W8M5F0_9FUNG|nr:hypothetical protein GGH94_004266 [Coemansia aciculifera]